MPSRRQPRFTTRPGEPDPLVAEAHRRVRFEEIDPLGIVWHGRYPSYLEDARAEFGRRYGLEYRRMHAEGFLAPVTTMHLDYLQPLEMDEEFRVRARLHWSEAARLDFDYEILKTDGSTAARAWTVQLLLSPERELLLVWPEYLERFRADWKAGRLA